MTNLIPLLTPGFSIFDQNIPLAILIVVFASFLFAGGSTIQHLAVSRSVDKSAENRSMGLSQVWDLVRNPRWLLGLGTVALGASMHIVGLMMAPVTVVQPVGILAVPWAVLLAAKIHHFRPSRKIWGAVALTIAGIVSFTLISASTAAPDTELPPTRIIVACLIVFVAGGLLGFFGRFGPAARRCLMWASGGSFFYGLSSALIKTITELVRGGGPHFLGRPLFWTAVVFLLICYLVGGWMVQQGYANGPAEIVVGSMTTTDPIIAVTFGMAVLGEGVRLGFFDGVGMAISGAIAVAGVVILSKYHPDAQGNQPKPAAEVVGSSVEVEEFDRQ
jgi:drug/metabolite transporter (DMT)-like permease